MSESYARSFESLGKDTKADGALVREVQIKLWWYGASRSRLLRNSDCVGRSLHLSLRRAFVNQSMIES